jgi:catechol 2,3-dioxygenase-like lactoylglutathione lyase family enzyme
MISVSLSVDVPNLADGVRFYTDAFGFAKIAEPVAGAKQEQFFENPEHGSVAMCSDPFDHGFCLIERRK